MKLGKILALDVGKKRIGYAVSDPECRVAFPRDFILCTSLHNTLAMIKKIVQEEEVQKIVIGLPLGEENEETDEAKSIRSLGDKLSQTLKLPIVYIDEFGTTKEAVSKIPLRKHKFQKGRDDSIAAQIILQRYLDSLVIK